MTKTFIKSDNQWVVLETDSQHEKASYKSIMNWTQLDKAKCMFKLRQKLICFICLICRIWYCHTSWVVVNIFIDFSFQFFCNFCRTFFLNPRGIRDQNCGTNDVPPNKIWIGNKWEDIKNLQYPLFHKNIAQSLFFYFLNNYCWKYCGSQ